MGGHWQSEFLKIRRAMDAQSEPGRLRVLSRPRHLRLHRSQLISLFLRALAFCCAIIVAAIVTLPAVAQTSNSTFATAQLQAVTPHLYAYAQVEPISLLSVSAAETGVVAGLSVAPGVHVRAGQRLASLKGPAIEALLLQAQADVRSAQANLIAAQKMLAIERQQLLSHLSTNQTVQQSENAVAQARAKLENAQTRMHSVRQMKTIVAPANGIVLKLNSSNGALVGAGQAILTLQPASGLWLTATYYGTDLAAIRVGMTGTFSPADNTPPIPVKVSAISGVMSPSGGESIAMVPTAPRAGWINGEFGTLTLNAPQRRLVAVPTHALILDQGHWWVLIHTAKGDRPQRVVPGPAQGWQTFIEQGLEPGAQVVVENAYLLFHASIARHYQLPD